MTEADIRINSNVDWALSVASCTYLDELLEPTMTHEIGHAYGLGHVSEASHGRLTMSTISDGPCSNAETTLGLGDIRGLRHLYPL
jgi:predicted Zn-dependent protease